MPLNIWWGHLWETSLLRLIVLLAVALLMIGCLRSTLAQPLTVLPVTT
jgi:hypothetical protein